MRTLASLVFAMVLLAISAIAQEKAVEVSPKGELRTIQGCLSKVGNTFVVTAGGDGPRQFRILGGDASGLDGKLGFTVRVVGMVGESGPLDSVAPPYNEGSTTGVGYNTVVAQKTKQIYSNCSEPGKEWSGDHM